MKGSRMVHKGLLVLCLLLLIGSASALPDFHVPVDFNLTGIKGATYIRWNWSITDSYNWSKTAYLNGIKLFDNQTTTGYYIQSPMDNNVEARMDLYIFNVTNKSEWYTKSATARTNDTSWEWWIGLTIVFMVLGYFVWIFNLTAIITALLTAQGIFSVTSDQYTIMTVWLMVPFTIFIAGATWGRK